MDHSHIPFGLLKWVAQSGHKQVSGTLKGKRCSHRPKTDLCRSPAKEASRAGADTGPHRAHCPSF